MKKLYFGASQGSSLISSIIRWFQWGDKNTHVFFIPSDTEKLDLKTNPNIIEAWHLPLLKGGAVREGFYLTLHPGNDPFDIYYVEVTDYQHEIFHKNIRKRLGEKYDLLGVIGFITKNLSTESKNRVFCSELLVDELYRVGSMIFHNTPAQTVSPSTFLTSPDVKLKSKHKRSRKSLISREFSDD